MRRIGKTCSIAASLLLVLLLPNIMPMVSVHVTSQDVNFKTKELPDIRANDPHGPIAIDGDANFSDTALAEGWSGDGSAQDPYIIENYDITMGPTPEASISITNTRANYTIQGCNLIGPAATPSYGIHLENSTNGIILNNQITNFDRGLNVTGGSKYVVVTGNNISYNSWGIWWEDSDNLTITQNLCSHNFFTGIDILSSNAGTISGNNCSGNGDNGIHMESLSKSHILTDNICSKNANSGIRLQAAIENIFENNTSNENNVGIWTTASNDNFIQWNIFANNTSNVLTDGTTPVVWDYNYWSDYTGSDADSDGIGDTPYNFGYADNYPLMFPPFPVEWVQLITDQHIEFGFDFEYSIAVHCPAPYDLWMNDSINFWLNVETVVSGTTLAVGDYPLAVNATNIYGYLTEAIFTVFVRDTTPPSMTQPSDFTYREDEDPDYMLEWIISDLSPLTFILLRDGIEITSYDVPTTPIFFSSNLENRGPGVYNYTMIAEDIWGNVATDMVLITITPIPFLEVMLPWLIFGSVAVVMVIVIVVILRKRRTIKSD